MEPFVLFQHWKWRQEGGGRRLDKDEKCDRFFTIQNHVCNLNFRKFPFSDIHDGPLHIESEYYSHAGEKLVAHIIVLSSQADII